MEIIAKISKGSRMDQVYIPKQRSGFPIGNYVIIKSIDKKEEERKKLNFYGLKSVEPIKIEIVERIIGIIDKSIENNNIIITGSFLEKGFDFNDIDILIIGSNKGKEEDIKKELMKYLGIEAHIIILDNKSLLNGLSNDPLYQTMLSRCVSKRKFILKRGRKINYKILDLHLLKSKVLIDNFDILNGNEKYDLVRNMTAIYLFLKEKKISVDLINKEIDKIFDAGAEEIKQNIINKKKFIKKYKKIYNVTFKKILEGIKNDSK